MNIYNSKGEREDFNPNKIVDKLKELSKGLKVSYSKVAQKTIASLIDGMTTEDIDYLSASEAEVLAIEHPDYSKLAGNIVASRLQILNRSFKETTIKLYEAGHLNEQYYSKVMKLYEEVDIDSLINHSNDYLFNYIGIMTLKGVNGKGSRLLHIKGKPVETPQFMYMRVAIWCSNTLEETIELYNEFSNLRISLASPIMFNSGGKNASLISCNLVHPVSNTGDVDSLEGMHETFHQVSKLSSRSAGIGLDITPYRSVETEISSTGGKAAGLVRVLKVLQELMATFNQGGKRSGSCAVYVQPWHKDIYDILKAAKPHTADTLRAMDLFYAVFMCDMFMDKLDKGDDEWYLFCPEDLRKNGIDLISTFGDEFKANYELAVSKGLGKLTSTKDLALAIASTVFEAGSPYMSFKDEINRTNMQDHIGPIHSSNLCVAPETLLLTDKGHIPIEELEGEKVVIWNGEEWSETVVYKTSDEAELYEVVLSDYTVLHVTDQHKWVVKNSYKEPSIEIPTIDLKTGDKLERCEYPIIEEGKDWEEKEAYTHGLFCSEGYYSQGNPFIYLYDGKKKLLPNLKIRNKYTGSLNNKELSELCINENGNKLVVGLHFDTKPKYKVPFEYNLKSKLRWLEGVVDGDGCIVETSGYKQIQLCSINLGYLKDIKLMLNTLGVNASISILKSEGFTLMPDGKGGSKHFPTKEAYRLFISPYGLTRLIDLGFSPSRLNVESVECRSNRSRLVTIKSVKKTERVSPTYCLTESIRHRMIVNGTMTAQCNEIVQHTSPDTVANCVLSSLNLPKFYVDGKIDYEALEHTCKVIVRFLNVIIDINDYPTKEALKGGIEQRAMGIGVAGLADLFALMDYTFDSKEAAKLNKELFNRLYLYSVKASNDLAKEKGMPKGMLYEGSKYSKGILHFDQYDCESIEYEGLRESIIKHGLYNTMFLALMPTASSGNVVNVEACFEPFKDMIYNKEIEKVRYLIVNQHLVKDLEELGIWSKSIAEDILLNGFEEVDLHEYIYKTFNRDSTIEETNRLIHLKNKYKSAYSKGMSKTIIDLASDRQPYIDQTQSMNLFTLSNDTSTLLSMWMYAWKKKLKTGSYYLRIKSLTKSNPKLAFRQDNVCSDGGCTI